MLRPISLTDSHDIFREFTSEITIYMFPKPPAQISDTETFIETSIKQMTAGENLQLVIQHGESGEFLGCTGIHKLVTETPELGIWLKKSAHGAGYGFETIRALVDWAKQHLQYTYLKYPVDKRNIASRKIPIKLKGVEGRQYKKMNQSGFELDEVEYWLYP